MTNVTESQWPLTAQLPDDPDATHLRGLSNREWPLCLEAQARAAGFSAAEIRKGLTGEEYEFDEDGFWAMTCRQCAAQAHA